MGPLWTLRLGQSGAAPFPLTKPDISTAHLQLMCPCGPDSLARSRERDKNSLPPHLLLLSHSSDSCVYLYATDSGLWCAFCESRLISFESAWFKLWAEQEPRGRRCELLPFLSRHICLKAPFVLSFLGLHLFYTGKFANCLGVGGRFLRGNRSNIAVYCISLDVWFLTILQGMFIVYGPL